MSGKYCTSIPVGIAPQSSTSFRGFQRMKNVTPASRNSWLARSVLYVVTMVCCAAIGTGQTSEFVGRTIRSVQYSHPEALHPTDLKRVSVLKVGDVLRAEDAAEAIDRLFATGRFEDIAIEVEPSGDGVAVRFVTEPTKFVSGFTVVGGINEPPNRGELTSASQIQLGARFRQEDVTSAVDRIHELLQSNGLYESRITPRVDVDSPGEQVFVTFNVMPGKRAKYDISRDSWRNRTFRRRHCARHRLAHSIIHWWRQVTDARTRKRRSGNPRQISETGPPDGARGAGEARLRRRSGAASVRQPEHQPRPKVKVKAVEAKVSNSVY